MTYFQERLKQIMENIFLYVSLVLILAILCLVLKYEGGNWSAPIIFFGVTVSILFFKNPIKLISSILFIIIFYPWMADNYGVHIFMGYMFILLVFILDYLEKKKMTLILFILLITIAIFSREYLI